MKEVRVKTTDLKTRLEVNRNAHSAQFGVAMDGWAKEVAQLMRADIEAIERGERRRLTALDPMPENHAPDYDRVLEMLEMSVDEHQTLDIGTFRQYVLDDWSWKERWTVSTAKYLSGE